MMVHVYTLKLASRQMCKSNMFAGTGVNTGKISSYNCISTVFLFVFDGKVQIYQRNVIFFSSPTMQMLCLSQCYIKIVKITGKRRVTVLQKFTP